MYMSVICQFASIEKQVLTTYTNLCLFYFLGTTPALSLNMWVNENPNIDTSPRELNTGQADALHHDYRQHT